MGRITETIDYLKRPLINTDVKQKYCNIEITTELKAKRRELKLYKK